MTNAEKCRRLRVEATDISREHSEDLGCGNWGHIPPGAFHIGQIANDDYTINVDKVKALCEAAIARREGQRKVHLSA